jgi:hypothetical protein
VSAGALRYAFRRLEREPVLVLATERSDRSLPPDDRTIPPDRREEIFLGPLSVEATRLVVSQFVDPLPRPRLERVHELSVGNPMYAIELARSIDLFDDSLTVSALETGPAISPIVESVSGGRKFVGQRGTHRGGCSQFHRVGQQTSPRHASRPSLRATAASNSRAIGPTHGSAPVVPLAGFETREGRRSTLPRRPFRR